MGLSKTGSLYIVRFTIILHFITRLIDKLGMTKNLVFVSVMAFLLNHVCASSIPGYADICLCTCETPFMCLLPRRCPACIMCGGTLEPSCEQTGDTVETTEAFGLEGDVGD